MTFPMMLAVSSYSAQRGCQHLATDRICHSTMPVAINLFSVMTMIILVPTLLTACILQCLGSAYLRSGQV